MKFLTLLFVLLFTPFVFSDDSTDTEAAYKATVKNSKSFAPYKHFPHRRYDFSELSDKFINSEGVVGEYGKFVSEAVRRVGLDCFHNKIRFEKLCPKYKSFSGEKKDKFLSFLFASIGIADVRNLIGLRYFSKSSEQKKFTKDNYVGKPMIKNAMRNGSHLNYHTGIGIYSLESRLFIRKANGRPSACLKKSMEYADMKPQIGCAVAMFSQFYCDKGWAIDRRTYWGSFGKSRGLYNRARRRKLRKKRHGAASGALRKFPGCE